MTTETILTDEQIRQAVQCLTAEMSLDGETLHLKNVNGCIRAIEQAVLQSKQVQVWKRDAERYRWLRDSGSDDMGVVTGIEGIDYGSTSVAYTHEDGLCGEHLDVAIDAAMEQQK